MVGCLYGRIDISMPYEAPAEMPIPALLQVSFYNFKSDLSSVKQMSKHAPFKYLLHDYLTIPDTSPSLLAQLVRLHLWRKDLVLDSRFPVIQNIRYRDLVHSVHRKGSLPIWPWPGGASTLSSSSSSCSALPRPERQQV